MYSAALVARTLGAALSPMRPSLSGPRLDRGDLLRAALLVLGCALVLASCFQTRMHGDGPGLVGFGALGTGESYNHVLFPRACRLLRELWDGGGPLFWPRSLVVGGAALACGSSYLLARGFGAERGAALAAALLLATAPGCAFYGTTVEIPALQAGVVGAAACVALFAPWRRPALALALVACTFPWVYFAHQSAALLGAGFVGLCALGRARKAPAFAAGSLLFLVGPVLLLGLIAAMASSSWLRGLGFRLSVQGEVEFIEAFTEASTWSRFLREGFASPLLLALPLAALGVWRWRRSPAPLACAGLLLLPSLAFFLWWGVPERGGYVVGCAPLYAPLVAAGAQGAKPLLLALLLALQLAVGALDIAAHDGRFDPERRARLVGAELSGAGLLLSGHNHAPPIAIWLPAVREVNLTDEWVAPAAAAGQTPEQFAALVLGFVEQSAQSGPLVIDLSWQQVDGHRTIERARPYWDAFLERLRAARSPRIVADTDWPLWVVEP